MRMPFRWVGGNRRKKPDSFCPLRADDSAVELANTYGFNDGSDMPVDTTCLDAPPPTCGRRMYQAMAVRMPGKWFKGEKERQRREAIHKAQGALAMSVLSLNSDLLRMTTQMGALTNHIQRCMASEARQPTVAIAYMRRRKFLAARIADVTRRKTVMEGQQLSLHEMQANMQMFDSLAKVASAIRRVGRSGMSVSKIDKHVDTLQESIENQLEISDAMQLDASAQYRVSDSELWEELLVETHQTTPPPEPTEAKAIALPLAPSGAVRAERKRKKAPAPCLEGAQLGEVQFI